MVYNARKNDASHGFAPWLFASTPRWGFLALSAALAGVFLFIGESFLQYWPVYLACECSVVALGIYGGWCWVKYDRAKMTRTIYPDSDIDRLGFFNSRIAMRSFTLFKITIADYPMEPGQKEKVLALVERYWRTVEAADEPSQPPPPASGPKVAGSAPPSSSAPPDDSAPPSHEPPDPGSMAGSGWPSRSGAPAGTESLQPEEAMTEEMEEATAEVTRHE